MQTAHSNPENKRYNAEVCFLDGLYDFHPDYFKDLSSGELQAIKAYYLTGIKDIPSNIFEYRLGLIKQKPELEQQAQKAFKKLLLLAGVKDFKS